MQGFTDTTGPITASHLHGAAGIGQTGNGPVLANLARVDSSADNGSIDTTITLNAANEALLLNGDTYINLHSAMFGGGELRGNLVVSAVPEPGTGLALCISLGVVAVRRRRR
jgi:hypothetical protein